MRLSAKEILAEIPEPKLEKEEKFSSSDEATDHAKAYWMLGWSWGEIEAILEDMGYEDKEITSAVNAAKEYANDCLSNGPFSTLKEGQNIKLKNGTSGKLITASNSHLVVAIGEDQITVDEKTVDLDKSRKLGEAYALRCAARDIIRTAQFQHGEIKEEDEDEESKELTPVMKEMVPEKKKTKKELQLPGKPQRKLIKPEPKEFDLEMTPSKRAPEGWGKDYPKLTEIPEVPKIAEDALNQLDGLEEMYLKVAEDLADVNAMAKEVRDKSKELTTKKNETAQQIFAIISTQTNDMDDLHSRVFFRYKNSLIGLEKTMQSETVPVNPMEELEALKELLATNYPRIAKETERALTAWKEQNEVMKETLHKALAVFTPAKQKTGQLLSKFKEWVSDAWAITKSITKRLTNVLFPEVDETVNAIDAYLGEYETAEVTAKVHNAIRSRIS